MIRRPALFLLFAAPASAQLPASRKRSAVSTMEANSTAVAAGSFNTLVAAVQAAGLEGTLRGEGPFTVFAPGVDDEAFVIAAGAFFDLSEEWQLGLNWRSELRDSSQSVHSVSFGASLGF